MCRTYGCFPGLSLRCRRTLRMRRTSAVSTLPTGSDGWMRGRGCATDSGKRQVGYLTVSSWTIGGTSGASTGRPSCSPRLRRRRNSSASNYTRAPTCSDMDGGEVPIEDLSPPRSLLKVKEPSESPFHPCVPGSPLFNSQSSYISLFHIRFNIYSFYSIY